MKAKDKYIVSLFAKKMGCKASALFEAAMFMPTPPIYMSNGETSFYNSEDMVVNAARIWYKTTVNDSLARIRKPYRFKRRVCIARKKTFENDLQKAYYRFEKIEKRLEIKRIKRLILTKA